MIQTNLLTLPWLKTPNLGCPKASIIFRLVSQFSWQNMWSSTPYCRLVERNHELNRQIWIWWDPPNCACNAFRSIKSLDMLVQRQRSSYDFFWTMPGCFRDLEPCKFLQGRMERQPAQTCAWGGVWGLSLSKEKSELGRPTKKVSVQFWTFFGWWFAVVSFKIHRKKLKQWTFGAFKGNYVTNHLVDKPHRTWLWLHRTRTRRLGLGWFIWSSEIQQLGDPEISTFFFGDPRKIWKFHNVFFYLMGGGEFPNSRQPGKFGVYNTV